MKMIIYISGILFIFAMVFTLFAYYINGEMFNYDVISASSILDVFTEFPSDSLDSLIETFVNFRSIITGAIDTSDPLLLQVVELLGAFFQMFANACKLIYYVFEFGFMIILWLIEIPFSFL